MSAVATFEVSVTCWHGHTLRSPEGPLACPEGCSISGIKATPPLKLVPKEKP